MSTIKKQIKALPQKPGVYLFKDAQGRILYIGKAVNLRNRVRSHFIPSSQSKFNPPAPPFAKGRLGGISDIDFIKTADEKDALILEDQLIKKYAPKYNIQWRDDKSYLRVNFTDDEWPRVLIVHNLKAKSYKLTADPIGPFTNGKELKRVLRALRKILPYRTCKNAYDKPCLQWHLGLCPAHGQSPIANRQSSKKTPNPPFAKGGSAVFCKKTVQEGLKKYHESLNTLKQFLRLYAGEPIRIEAYDISNIQGTSATGSMIVFDGYKPKKSDYRKFRIKTVRGANDVAMLKEVLSRRLNHKEWPLPDIMLIDGGQTQLNAAVSQFANRLVPSDTRPAIISLAKKEEELYTIYSDKTLLLSKLPVDLRLLFQAIRNEAHRFAISYYRKLHRRKLRQ
ncbi:MAG: GIY-YIG nuclease family protein [Candidatus Portnoybacteria bacterium]|nr:GIY-YIG nuclease family protein [Candidatus Portnoybacteria bacterium]MDD4983184.1 GIY-YIG nuclease family protein [Candidatus Portnoybacteria bacterium]